MVARTCDVELLFLFWTSDFTFTRNEAVIIINIIPFSISPYFAVIHVCIGQSSIVSLCRNYRKHFDVNGHWTRPCAI